MLPTAASASNYLFQTTDPADELEVHDEGWGREASTWTRARLTHVNIEVLERASRSEDDPFITLNLFDDLILDVRFTGMEQVTDTEYVWLGEIGQLSLLEEPWGRVAFLMEEGRDVYGMIEYMGLAYQVLPVSDGSHVVVERDNSSLQLPCGNSSLQEKLDENPASIPQFRDNATPPPSGISWVDAPKCRHRR